MKELIPKDNYAKEKACIPAATGTHALNYVMA